MPTATSVPQNISEDVLAIIKGPLNNFLTALQAPNVNYQTVLQDFSVLQLAELQNGPAVQSVGISDIAAAIYAKLNAAPAAPAPTPAA